MFLYERQALRDRPVTIKAGWCDAEQAEPRNVMAGTEQGAAAGLCRARLRHWPLQVIIKPGLCLPATNT